MKLSKPPLLRQNPQAKPIRPVLLKPQGNSHVTCDTPKSFFLRRILLSRRQPSATCVLDNVTGEYSEP